MAAPTPQPAPTTDYTGLTFLQMQNLAGGWFGQTTTDLSSADLALLKALLNEAIARINILFPGLVGIRKYYTITTTGEQASYLVPKGLIHIHDPIVLDDVPVYSIPTVYQNRTSDLDLEPEDQNTVRMYSADWGVNDAAATAAPQAILTFHPAPEENGTAEVWGTGNDNALSADADLCRIPTAYTSTPVYHAVQPFLATRGRKKDLETAKAMWNSDMGDIQGLALRERTRGQTMQIPNYMRSGRGRRFPGTYRAVP